MRVAVDRRRIFATTPRRPSSLYSLSLELKVACYACDLSTDIKCVRFASRSLEKRKRNRTEMTTTTTSIVNRVSALFCCCCCLLIVVVTSIPPTCNSPIYCHGELLHLVQTYEIFPDSKTFVDKMMRYDQDQVVEHFERMMAETDNNPSREQIQKFVDVNFSESPDLDPWLPPDYTPNPKFISHIKDDEVRNFAKTLVSTWPKLSRKVNENIIADSSRVSLIPVPNGFIIPGGRFLEYYNWDTYWIVKGLLLSEMKSTVRGMLDNMMSLVKRFGFVPNGGRVYYATRSQPPLLSFMAREYVEMTSDYNWLKDNIEYMELEIEYWLDERFLDVETDRKVYKLARYKPESSGPRPEAYREDIATAMSFSPDARQRVYTDLKGGAESGWDFSVRWMYDEQGNPEGKIRNIFTRRTIPVDLNSLLGLGFKNIGYFHELTGNEDRASFWHAKHKEMLEAIKDVFWNEEDGTWYDYDLYRRRQRTFFAVSNLSPLWCRMFDENNSSLYAKRTVAYLQREGVLKYEGGIPTTLFHTGQQWDMPNVWAPMQSLVVQGLVNTQHPEAFELSKEIGVKFVKSLMLGYNNSHEMFEKYDARTTGVPGGGGEYAVQTGFGWTNGVALEFIYAFFT